MMNQECKYITVLDHLKGKVYTYDYDASTSLLGFITARHNLDNVQYMVHPNKPELWAKKLYYGKR